MRDNIIRAVKMLVLVAVQAFLLNNMNLFGYATPYLYIYLILCMEVDESPNKAMLWAFAMGLLVDIFSNTPGINAASSVMLAFVRPAVLRLYVSRESLEHGNPSLRTTGGGAFIKYAATAVLLHHTMLVLLCYFDMGDAVDIVLRIVASSAFTLALVLMIENIRK